jgi:hypothetical protein
VRITISGFKKLAAAVAGLFLATLLLWQWRDGNYADATGDQRLAQVAGANAPADADDSTPGTGFRMAGAPSAPGSDEFVAAILANPAQPPPPSTFSGEAQPLQYALTSEYSGAVLSSTENVSQLQVVPMIGVLARTSDRAWQFLVSLTRPDAWGWIQVWSEDYLTEQYQSEERSLAHVRATLQGKVIHALAASGRPEFMTWANSLYEGGG